MAKPFNQLSRVSCLFILLVWIIPGGVGGAHAQTEKIQALSEILMQYEYHPADTILKHSRALSSQLGPSVSSSDSAWIYWAIGLEKYHAGERQLSGLYFRKARQIATETSMMQLIPLLNRIEGILARENRLFSQAHELINQSIEEFKALNLPLQLQFSYFESGNNWYALGRHTKALNLYLKALEAAPESRLLDSKLNYAIGKTYYRLAKLFRLVQSLKYTRYLQEAKRYMQSSLEDKPEAVGEGKTCLTLIQLCNISLELHSYEELRSYLKMLEDCRGIPDYDVELGLLIVEARTAKTLEQNTEKALAILDQMEQQKYRWLAPTHYFEAQVYRAQILFELDSNETAFERIEQAADWFYERNDLNQALNAYQLWIRELASNDQSDKYLRLRPRVDSLQQQLFSEADLELFEEVKQRYETEALSNELEVVHSKSINQRKYLLLLVILLLSVILISGLIFYINHLRSKKALLQLEIESERARQLAWENQAREATIQKLELEQELIREMNRTANLESEKLHQQKMMEALRHLQHENLRVNLANQLRPYSLQLVRKKDREDFDQLIHQLEENQQDQAIEQFEQVFTQAYGDFYSRLIQLNPDFGRNELHLAALLRLNLSSKEIAGILNISQAAIEKTRHQIRQKLQLKRSDSLTTFLMSL